jgi:hypothetical protein
MRNRIAKNITPILLAGILVTLAGPRVVGFAEDRYAEAFPCGIGVGQHIEYVNGIAAVVCDNEPQIGTLTRQPPSPLPPIFGPAATPEPTPPPCTFCATPAPPTPEPTLDFNPGPITVPSPPEAPQP